jgi:hypothetical protein
MNQQQLLGKWIWFFFVISKSYKSSLKEAHLSSKWNAILS